MHRVGRLTPIFMLSGMRLRGERLILLAKTVETTYAECSKQNREHRDYVDSTFHVGL